MALFTARRESGPTSTRRSLDPIGALLERLEHSDPTLGQLAVPQDLYAERLDLEREEREQILAITGEYGETLAVRLAATEATSASELRKIAEVRIQYWHTVASGTDGRSFTTTEAARVIARSFENIASLLDTHSIA
jgi:hypothetical protein